MKDINKEIPKIRVVVIDSSKEILSVSLIVSLSIMTETFKKIDYILVIDSAGEIDDATFLTMAVHYCS